MNRSNYKITRLGNRNFKIDFNLFPENDSDTPLEFSIILDENNLENLAANIQIALIGAGFEVTGVLMDNENDGEPTSAYVNQD